MNGFTAHWHRLSQSAHTLAALGLTIAAFATSSPAAEPMQAPKPSASRYVPASGLVAYLEYEGLATHAKGWEATAARGMIEKAPVGVMVDEISKQLIDRVLKEMPEVKLSSADLLAIHHDLILHGFSGAVYDHGGCVVVLNGLGGKGRRERLERVLKAVAESSGTKPSAPERIRGRDVNQVMDDGDGESKAVTGEGDPVPDRNLPPEEKPKGDPVPDRNAPPEEKPNKKPPAPYLSWWFEGEDLVVVIGPDADVPVEPAADGKKAAPARTHKDHRSAVLDTIEKKQPDASTHAGYIAARDEGKDIAGFEPNGLLFVEIAGNAAVRDLLLDGAAAPFDSLSISGLHLSSQISGRPTDAPERAMPGYGAEPMERVLKPGGIPDPDAPRAVPTPGNRTPLLRLPPEAPTAPSLVYPPARGTSAPSTLPPSEPPPDSPLPAPAPAPRGGPQPAPAPAPPGDPVPARAPAPAPRGGLIPAPVYAPQEGPLLGSPPAELRLPFDALGELPANPFQAEPTLSPDDPQVKAQAEKERKEMLELLGLDGVTRIVGRWGFQGKGLLTDVRLESRAPHRGLLGLATQSSFRKDKLPPIPANVGTFAIGSMEPGKSFDTVVAMLKKAQPELGGQIDAVEKTVKDLTGLQLRQDLLSCLGPSWCSFEIPDPTRAKDDHTGYVLVAEINDRETFGKTLDAMVKLANKTLLDLDGGDGKGEGARKENDPPILLWEPLPAPERGYQLTSPAGLVFWANEETRPTILVGKSYAAFALNPARARIALSAESRSGEGWKPIEEVARTFACLPGTLTSLSVADPSNSLWPTYLSSLPALVQTGSNMLGFASDDESSPVSGLQAVLGIPGSKGFRVRIPPNKIPKAATIRSYLFPSVLATTVDDRGIRWIGREAFPIACIGGGSLTKPSITYNLSNPGKSVFKYNFDILRALGQ